MQAPALIFDFGNVIGFFDFQIAFDRIADPRGLDGKRLVDRSEGSPFARLQRAFEHGSINPREFAQGIGDIAGFDLPFDELKRAWNGIFQVNTSIVSLIEALDNAGYTLILGSNTNALHVEQFRSQFATVLEHFDRLILSFEIGAMKPAKSFYHACVESTGVSAHDCIFIDDLRENVQGASAAGLVGLQYRSTPELIGQLRKLGVTWNQLQSD